MLVVVASCLQNAHAHLCGGDDDVVTTVNLPGRGQMTGSTIINTIGDLMSAAVLLVALAAKVVKGAGYAVAATVVLFIMMNGIQGHCARARSELAVDDCGDDHELPSQVHPIAPVSKIHKPTLHGLAYARATRRWLLEARATDVEPEQTQALPQEWDRRSIPVALKGLDPPLREITSSFVEYVMSARRASPRDVVMVDISERVVGRWYELLHNQTVLPPKSSPFPTPEMMVTSVPWQMRSSHRAQVRFGGAGDYFEGAPEQLDPAQGRLGATQRPLQGAGAGSVGRG